MKCNWSHIVGSVAFFNDREGFTPHDKDMLQLMNNWDMEPQSMICRIDNVDYFLYPDVDGKILISQCTDPLTIGKFLVPEVAEYLKITAKDLLPLSSLAEKLSNTKHEYVKILFDAAIKSNVIKYDKQTLDKAWTSYCKYRNIN